MKSYIIYILLVVFSFSCGVSNHTRKAVGIAFNSTIITQKAMTKILIESTASIIQEDSLKPNTAIYIHSLTASFVSRLDSFELTFDSVKAVWTNDTTLTFSKVVVFDDTTFYDQVTIPSYNSYLGSDTLNVSVMCEYFPSMENINGKNSIKCLMADYVIEKQSIIVKNNFKNCSVNTPR